MAIQSGHKDLRDLIMGDLTQFHIPIYQRSYTWDAKKELEKLIDDILEFGEEYKNNTQSEYYIGNLIIKNQTRDFITEKIVIDGQQRITSTILILCAIRDVCLNKIKTDYAAKYAFNISKSLYTIDNNKTKLKLNNMEHQKCLEAILTGKIKTITENNKKTNYWKNYRYLHLRFEKMLATDEFFNFTTLLERVKVVLIYLDEDQDENSVFESINSLGKSLSSSDLIKNFLFTFRGFNCSHDKEKELTDLYTKELESLFANETNIAKELEKFFRQYIAVYTHTLVKNDPKIIYYSFKKIVGVITSYDQSKARILDLLKWGIIYQAIRREKFSQIEQNYLEYLRASSNTYITLLMDVFAKNCTINDGALSINNPSQLNKILTKVVAYAAARFIAGLHTRDTTQFTPTIAPKLASEDPEYYLNYAETFEKLVTTTIMPYGQPSINTLKRASHNTNLYDRTRKPLLLFLVLLENIGRDKPLSFDDGLDGCTIVHILPQQLDSTWGQNISK